MFNFDRNPDKPRKDIGKWSEVRDAFSFMFDETFDGKYAEVENVSKEDAKKMLELYKDMYDEKADNNEWFETMKVLAEKVGFAREVKEYKKNPESYPGHVGDVSNIIRVAVTGRTKSPDLCSIMKLLGREKVLDRIEEIEVGIYAEIDLTEMYDFRKKCTILNDIKDSYEVEIK